MNILGDISLVREMGLEPTTKIGKSVAAVGEIIFRCQFRCQFGTFVSRDRRSCRSPVTAW